MTGTPPTLSLSDACDRCGSQAYVSVELGARTLLFCHHHGEQHEQALSAVADRIHKQAVPVRVHTGERGGAWNDGTRF